MSEEDQIRRLLADAKHTDPIPPDVAGRMDEVIADLRADRPVPSPVTELAAARRRRRARTLLVAAAVVVVAGIGIDQLRGVSISAGGGADAGADSAADRPEAASEAGGARQPGLNSYDFAAGRATRIAPDQFGQQVRELRDAHDNRTASGSATSDSDGRFVTQEGKSPRCRASGPGRVVPVRYGDAPGVLVFRPPSGDTQVVDLVLCGHSGIARTITLPAP